MAARAPSALRDVVAADGAFVFEYGAASRNSVSHFRDLYIEDHSSVGYMTGPDFGNAHVLQHMVQGCGLSLGVRKLQEAAPGKGGGGGVHALRA